MTRNPFPRDETILSHMARHETILLVVTHENFD
jgi:hypothetical protein